MRKCKQIRFFRRCLSACGIFIFRKPFPTLSNKSLSAIAGYILSQRLPPNVNSPVYFSLSIHLSKVLPLNGFPLYLSPCSFVFGNRFKSGRYFDTFFFQHFFIHNAVAAVSRKAVEHIHDYVPERSAFCIRNHSLKSRAGIVRSRPRLVGINVYDLYIFILGKLFAYTNLSLNALFVLTLRTESGVDNSFINSFPSGKIFIFSAKQSIGKGRNSQGTSRKYNQ